MRPFRALLPFEEAQARIAAAVTPITAIEDVPCAESLGRILADDISAPIAVPAFTRAAMDGYAVLAADTYGASGEVPKVLEQIGELFAGDVPERTLASGQAYRIATGGVVPTGADAVVMIEHVEVAGTRVSIDKPIHPGGNISAAGSDMERGDLVLVKGTILTPARIGALTSLGFATVKVVRRPKVTVFTTGDEIQAPGSELLPGKVFDSNGFTLATLMQERGAVVTRSKVDIDTREALQEALDGARGQDLILFSGGSSVGDRDLVVDLLGDNGEVIFHGVQIKPGKPLLFGKVGDALVFGVPGYPTSALVNGYALVAPVLDALTGARRTRHLRKAKLGKRINSALGRTQFMPVRFEGELALPTFRESGAITSLTGAEGFVIIPANQDLCEEGEEVDVLLL